MHAKWTCTPPFIFFLFLGLFYEFNHFKTNLIHTNKFTLKVKF